MDGGGVNHGVMRFDQPCMVYPDSEKIRPRPLYESLWL